MVTFPRSPSVASEKGIEIETSSSTPSPTASTPTNIRQLTRQMSGLNFEHTVGGLTWLRAKSMIMPGLQKLVRSYTFYTHGTASSGFQREQEDPLYAYCSNRVLGAMEEIEGSQMN
jgi:hypothetical protein